MAAFKLINPSLLEVQTFETSNAVVLSRHLLDELLGNRNGEFDLSYRNYSRSARNARIAGDHLIAELRKVNGSWTSASIRLRVQQIQLLDGITHNLTFVSDPLSDDSNLSVADRGMADTRDMPPNPRLQGQSTLIMGRFSAVSDHGRLRYGIRSYDLDARVGVDNGFFTFEGTKFSSHARNIRLVGLTLLAELETRSGDWNSDSISLDWLVDGSELESRERLPRGLLPPLQPYAPLSRSPGHSRLCYIHPGIWDDPVCCTILPWNLHEVKTYSCLSYVWGDAKDSVRISVNSVEVYVTRNLFHAIRQLRWHEITGAVWIDALCINQNHDDEKSWQVAQMADIYTGAEQVIISMRWHDSSDRKILRELDDEFPLVICIFIRSAAEHGDICQALKEAVAPILTKIPALKGNPHQLVAIFQKAAILLADMHWFKRVWTAQEYALAKKTFFLLNFGILKSEWCHTVSKFNSGNMPGLSSAVSWLCSATSRSHEGEEELEVFFERVLNTTMAYLFHRLSGLPDRSTFVYNEDELTDVADMYKPLEDERIVLAVQYGRHRQSSDPRDKIFAFARFGMARFQSLKPNYSSSTSEVYKAFTLNVIQRSGSLDVWHLAAEQDNPSPELQHLPSWVIDWTAPGKNRNNFQYCTKFNNTPFPLPDFSSFGRPAYDDSRDCLIIHGRRFDAIQTMTERPWTTDYDLSSHNRYNTSQILPWMQFVGLDLDTEASEKSQLWSHFCRTMLGNKFFTDPDHHWPSIPGDHKAWREITDCDEKAFKAFVLQAAQSPPNGILWSELVGETFALSRLIICAVADRHLFVSNKGALGVCPTSAQSGDALFHVAGSRWPVILRPSSKVSNGVEDLEVLYELVGPCYVDGVKTSQVEDALRDGHEIRLV